MWKQTATGAALAFRISGMVLATIAFFLFLGYVIDELAGTTPFAMLAAVVLAVTFSTLAVYSMVVKSFPLPPPSDAQEPKDADDGSGNWFDRG